ncbi:MAG: radical SAM family heme chaperone HemW [Armatimonadota bacterium]|nr:radical SAM family heme chaperone HemW [Armatimonadota bacterium]
MSASGLSVYVHLPFCARKCHYCDFNSGPAPAPLRSAYLSALHAEIARRGDELSRQPVHTIYFGGGTPTLYPAHDLGALLAAITGRCATEPDAEVSVEANPESVDEAKLRALQEAGFNRLSLGAQSFDDRELELLGRGHTSGDTERAARAARRAGVENLSLDLIYALPGQTVARWRRTLTRALALEPEHVSAYGLELAEGTRLFKRWQSGEIEPPAEAEHLAMREATRELCEGAGLRRYEISNYARPGFECRHNITYWHNEPYLGLGAGAWSYLDGVRSANLREPEDYVAALDAGEEPRAYAERLDPDDALAEAVMMGLRMVEGLEVAALKAAYGPERVSELLGRAEPLAEMGLVELGQRLRLTEAGEPLHGEVVVRLA